MTSEGRAGPKTLPDSQRQALLQGTLAEWGLADPHALLDWLSTQPVEALPKNLTSTRQLAAQEPEALGQWITSLPPGELRESSQLTLASELAKQGRVTEALQHFPRNSTTDSLSQSVREFAATIGGHDAAATAQWVSILPTSPAQAAAAQGLVGSWAQQSPGRVGVWVESLPVGTTRDAATGALAAAVVTVDPGAATAWLAQIGDPARKNAAMHEVFRGWARFNPAGARQWLRDFPGVDDAMKSRLLRSK